MGAEPFPRGRQGATLAEAGRALPPHARRTPEARAEGPATGAAHRAARRGALVAGTSTSPGRGPLPATRSRFTTAHPDAVVRVCRVSWDDPMAGLADGGADVAFV
ncbi:hypothetical protein AB0L74_03295 [Streptomyces sp. NPDC052020]|uniref:hypothetical protein n=1 Tax=Streptomyces sp. NPDC052020 TaxID=3155677 RepID=UPI003417D330